MDSADNTKQNDSVEKKNRTLWVGNLHPKVSYKILAELLYQVITMILVHNYINLIILLTSLCFL